MDDDIAYVLDDDIACVLDNDDIAFIYDDDIASILDDDIACVLNDDIASGPYYERLYSKNDGNLRTGRKVARIFDFLRKKVLFNGSGRS